MKIDRVTVITTIVGVVAILAALELPRAGGPVNPDHSMAPVGGAVWINSHGRHITAIRWHDHASCMTFRVHVGGRCFSAAHGAESGVPADD